MADAEVFRRIDELMYFKHEFRWIYLSLKRLSDDFIRHNEKHFTPVEGQAPLFENYPNLAILPLLLKRFEPRTRRPTVNVLEVTKVPYLQHYDDPRCLDKET